MAWNRSQIREFLIDKLLSKSIGRYYRLRDDLIKRHVVVSKKPAIWPILLERSLEDTADYIESNLMSSATHCFSKDELLDVARNLLHPPPRARHKPIRVYEFGVHNGESLYQLSKVFTDAKIFGFDSFRGLPEAWTGTHTRAGYFNLDGQVPEHLNAIPNLTLVVGWFRDSLPKFLGDFPNEKDTFIDLIHIDVDIYKSAQEVLEFVSNRIASGTLIIFDEYFGYPNWRQHEFKAFQEFCVNYNSRYEYIAFTTRQVLVRIL